METQIQRTDLGTWRQEEGVGKRWWDKGRDQHGNIYANICRTDSQWEFAVRLRELKTRLCDKLEEWDQVGDKKEAQEGGDVCIPVADSC